MTPAGLALLALLAQAPAEPRAPGAASDARAPARIESLLDPIRAKSGVPALAGAVVHAGRIVALGATGVRKLGAEREVELDDLWHVGSCGKSMTAVLAATLAEHGGLALETTLTEAFPELVLHQDYRDVTLARLLAHRGGLPVDPSAELWERLAPLAPDAGRALLARELLRAPPASPPGSDWVYSNAGYLVVAAALERASGATFEELLRREVLAPLGLASAGFGAPGSPGEALDQPWGHVAFPGTAEVTPVEPGPAADNPAAFAPAGAMHCSIADLARYAAEHLAGARGESRRLLPATWRALHAPLAGESYALGWNVDERVWSRGRALAHAGSNRRWFALVWIGPERDLALVSATNSGAGAAACDEAMWAMIRWFKEHVEGLPAER